MTDENHRYESESAAVANFMNRVAAELGRDDPAPDPTLIWVKARLARQTLEHQRERRAGLMSTALSGFAAAIAGWAALKWIPPLFTAYSGTMTILGAMMIIVVAILYFGAYRPLSNAN